MSLEDQLNEEFAPAWRPEEGDVITGNVVSITQRQGDFDPYWIVTLEKDDGQREAIHAFHTRARQELERIRPQVGHRIAMKYLGKRQGKTYSYHDYRGATENAPSVEWEKSTDNGQQELVASDIPSDTGEFAPVAPVPRDEADNDIPF